ncbi:hypothetical protein E4420_17475 [Stenotrophomonas maltophilia]|uniref:DUF3693 domain-containing protein n=1 Tax=Stenotrophomonas maltophilia TaxID=40324 RepID=UPI0011101110|nr:DUF3693 domain-containing protein [Stenotrophomonas maltophilia]TIL16844.1 hypothetical protein E4420_17475 [Stenotrophomonas maltophilia]
MRSIDLLLDKAREKCERPSDRALAEKLRVTASAVSKWRKGGVITEMHATALAAIAGLDGEIVVRVMEEQAETPAQRRVWRSVLDRLSAAAAVLMLVVFAAPGAARAKAIDSQGFSGSDQPHSVYYVQSIPGDAGVPFASIPSRPGSYGFLHRPIRVLCMPQAIQPQTKPTPRDNDLFLFKGGSIQSLIGHESQRSQ